MLLVSSHRGQLQTSRDAEIPSRKSNGFATGLAAIDGLLGGGFARGTVHELLAEPGGGMPMFFAAMLARAGMRGSRWEGGKVGRWEEGAGGVTVAAEGIGGAAETGGGLSPLRGCLVGQAPPYAPARIPTACAGGLQSAAPAGAEDGQCFGHALEGATLPIIPSSHLPIGPPSFRGVVVWSDPQGRLYPPAVAAMGIGLERLLILRPRDEREELWAAAECMRCCGVAATVVNPRRLSRLEARRLQLAAEGGGGIGILLRTLGRDSREYSAATRWLIRPAPGERMVQRWKLELIHGHGGRIGQCVILEVCRETNHVRAFEAVGGGLVQEAVA